ncbi:hypothetical protein BDA96_06G093600 [Sorghum bicolor]|uniref:Uncharacterized protein n=1 Tax=Sorghum bicolor TaxID=4558 RepID=A0A921QQ70_SORBI|nr:hypothetical protein BDA96_06G093600 [Sorghum bicolor]
MTTRCSSSTKHVEQRRPTIWQAGSLGCSSGDLRPLAVTLHASSEQSLHLASRGLQEAKRCDTAVQEAK